MAQGLHLLAGAAPTVCFTSFVTVSPPAGDVVPFPGDSAPVALT